MEDIEKQKWKKNNKQIRIVWGVRYQYQMQQWKS